MSVVSREILGSQADDEPVAPPGLITGEQLAQLVPDQGARVCLHSLSNLVHSGSRTEADMREFFGEIYPDLQFHLVPEDPSANWQ